MWNPQPGIRITPFLTISDIKYYSMAPKAKKAKAGGKPKKPETPAFVPETDIAQGPEKSGGAVPAKQFFGDELPRPAMLKEEGKLEANVLPNEPVLEWAKTANWRKGGSVLDEPKHYGAGKEQLGSDVRVLDKKRPGRKKTELDTEVVINKKRKKKLEEDAEKDDENPEPAPKLAKKRGQNAEKQLVKKRGVKAVAAGNKADKAVRKTPKKTPTSKKPRKQHVEEEEEDEEVEEETDEEEEDMVPDEGNSDEDVSEDEAMPDIEEEEVAPKKMNASRAKASGRSKAGGAKGLDTSNPKSAEKVSSGKTSKRGTDQEEAPLVAATKPSAGRNKKSDKNETGPVEVAKNPARGRSKKAGKVEVAAAAEVHEQPADGNSEPAVVAEVSKQPAGGRSKQGATSQAVAVEALEKPSGAKKSGGHSKKVAAPPQEKEADVQPPPVEFQLEPSDAGKDGKASHDVKKSKAARVSGKKGSKTEKGADVGNHDNGAEGAEELTEVVADKPVKGNGRPSRGKKK